MKQQYRIESWRFDVRRSTYSEPVFEGETIEECDAKAIAHFRAESDKESNSWNGMSIERIDAPAVREKVTLLEKNGRQEGDHD